VKLVDKVLDCPLFVLTLAFERKPVRGGSVPPFLNFCGNDLVALAIVLVTAASKADVKYSRHVSGYVGRALMLCFHVGVRACVSSERRIKHRWLMATPRPSTSNTPESCSFLLGILDDL
jgi:hypothetical protein